MAGAAGRAVAPLLKKAAPELEKVGKEVAVQVATQLAVSALTGNGNGQSQPAGSALESK